MRMVSEGKTSKEIAVVLDLGQQTIQRYRRTMMKKLGVSNIDQLTQAAVAAGITTWPQVARLSARILIRTIRSKTSNVLQMDADENPPSAAVVQQTVQCIEEVYGLLLSVPPPDPNVGTYYLAT